MSKITSAQLKAVIYSLYREDDNAETFINNNSQEFAELLETLVLPELHRREYVETQNLRRRADDELSYELNDNDESLIWDGCD